MTFYEEEEKVLSPDSLVIEALDEVLFVLGKKLRAAKALPASTEEADDGEG